MLWLSAYMSKGIWVVSLCRHVENSDDLKFISEIIKIWPLCGRLYGFW